MYIVLTTPRIWTFSGDFWPAVFVEGLRSLLRQDDILVFGCYSPSRWVDDELIRLGGSRAREGTAYSTSFDLNRKEHPDGRPYEMEVVPGLFDAIERLVARHDGQADKALFFDHALGFRGGQQTSGLFDFHDAFNGGSLRLSGDYAEQDVQQLAGVLDCPFASEANPDCHQTP